MSARLLEYEEPEWENERHWLIWTSRPARLMAGLRRLHREHGLPDAATSTRTLAGNPTSRETPTVATGRATRRIRCDIFIYVAKILSVSIPDELMRETEEIARAQGRTKSELVRDALRRQLQLERLRALQRYGQRQAEERGIGPEDAEALVDGLRAERG